MKMLYALSVFSFLFLNSALLIAQQDTLIRYTISNKSITIIPPVQFNINKESDNTSWDFGTEPGFQILDTNPPAEIYNGSGFTDLIPAHNLFSINNFPVRTAVKIFFINNDSLKQKCSGIFVQKNYVLTDCHCIGSFDSNRVFIFQDNIMVAPSYDNAEINAVFGTSKSTEYITFKSNMKGNFAKDIALIKLNDDIGNKTGWIGIAFNKDLEFFRTNVFHKLSYPGTYDYFDSTRYFNGDTLYYQYGRLDEFNNALGYDITGIIGQSGSSLFYTDNEDYYSFGTQVWSSGSLHIKITPEIFYSFKFILDNALDVDKPSSQLNNYFLSDPYPNPFNSTSKFNYILPEESRVIIQIFDLLGREVALLADDVKPAGIYNINLDAKDLTSGTYFYQIRANQFSQTKKLILLK